MNKIYFDNNATTPILDEVFDSMVPYLKEEWGNPSSIHWAGREPKKALGAVLGSIVGIFFGLPGLIVGPFIGAVAGELTVKPDLAAAGRAGIGATIGLAIGTAAKLSLGFTMVLLYISIRILNG